jgi:Cu(I)/Ag(I) efflux system membrane protein CusA/SilA
MSMIESVAILRPEDEWREGMTSERIREELDQVTRTPGVANMWSMPIKNRLDMLLTGVKTPVGIKIYGPDLATLERIGKEIEGLLSLVEGTSSVYAERAMGGRYIERGLRDTPEEIGRTLVAAAGGAQVPLAQLATIRFTPGPDMIKSENARLNSVAYVDVRERDIGSYVEDARRSLDERLDLPPGYRLEWTGQYQYMREANRRLRIMVPIAIAIIFLILWLNFRSVSETLIVMLSLPFALVGSVWLLWLLDYNLSVAVWIGMIALAGVAAETGVIMLLYLDRAWEARNAAERRGERDLYEAIVEGAVLRLRPKMMTVSAIILGLLPILWSHGTGATVMKRIAAPMVGGMVSATVLTLVVIPAIYSLWRERELRRGHRPIETVAEGEASEPVGPAAI